MNTRLLKTLQRKIRTSLQESMSIFQDAKINAIFCLHLYSARSDVRGEPT